MKIACLNFLTARKSALTFFVAALSNSVLPASATANEPDAMTGARAALPSCRDQIAALCANENHPPSLVKCLIRSSDSLSDSCKQEVQRFARAVGQSEEQTGGALSRQSGLNSLTPPFPVLIYEGRYSPGDISLSENRLNFSTPVYGSQTDFATVSLGFGHTMLGRDVQLTSESSVPKELNRTEIGSQYTRRMAGGKNWGLRGSIGYAGDRLFHNMRETAFSITAQYGYPSANGNFWMWSLFLSNNSPLGNYIPIPGVLYIYKTQTFTGMFGFPILSLQWTPAKDRAYSLSLLGLSLTGEAAAGDIRAVQYFATLKWANQNYILSVRVDDKDRLTIEEKRVAVGLRSLVFGSIQAEAQAGYAFDRLLYVGSGLRNMRRGSSELDPNWFVGLSLKAGL